MHTYHFPKLKVEEKIKNLNFEKGKGLNRITI